MSAFTYSPDAVTRAARRVMERCDALALCTERPGEITRTFCSTAMQESHRLVRGWMTAAGLRSWLDAAGNLIGRRESASSGQSRTLLIGSHLDSVVNAGRYDGVLGVMLGLAVAEVLNESNVALPLAIEVIGFCEEEGVRYQTPYIGSRAFASGLPAELLTQRDAQGHILADVLRAFGGDPERAASATFVAPFGQVVAYIEPHIEQGPLLEMSGVPLGVVTGITGQTRASVTFRGQAGHAGTVPMTARRDALAAAAEFILDVERMAHARPGLVATVGQIDVTPNVGNVIPGEARLRLDLRHLDDAVRDAAFQELGNRAAAIAQRRGVTHSVGSVLHQPAVPCESTCLQMLEHCMIEAGLQPLRLASGAGHDAAIMAQRFPVGMLFVRCAGGVSHHPDEAVTTDDVAAALDVLCRLVGKLATIE